ncbi:MAG: sugar phosphate isomerase/epimerase family protein [Luteolibacter sp.]
MKLTGFTDEAGKDLATQIKATKALGWDYISLRGIDGKNAHELSDDAFAKAADQLDEAGIKVAEFGSLIGNWAKPISSDFDITLAEIDRAIPRMKRTGTKLVRIMSYAQEPWGADQQEEERFRRLREIVSRFSAADITAAHENCMNWGGFSAAHTLRLIDEVPGLRLIFDTGNPVFQLDRSKPNPDGTFPWQDAWEFYKEIESHISHIHIKDCHNPKAPGEEPEYVSPGQGQGYVKEILKDLATRDYKGFIAIEPHVATVFHIAAEETPDWQQCHDSYLDYGKALEKLMD